MTGRVIAVLVIAAENKFINEGLVVREDDKSKTAFDKLKSINKF